jgi:hypothetical protein
MVLRVLRVSKGLSGLEGLLRVLGVLRVFKGLKGPTPLGFRVWTRAHQHPRGVEADFQGYSLRNDEGLLKSQGSYGS